LPAATGTVSCRPGGSVRYICPQRIDLNGEDTGVTLYFRVSAPDENVSISLCCNGKELRKRQAVKVNPGEIEQMKINTAELAPGELVINVTKEA
jgi:hypothetical protein